MSDSQSIDTCNSEFDMDSDMDSFLVYQNCGNFQVDSVAGAMPLKFEDLSFSVFPVNPNTTTESDLLSESPEGSQARKRSEEIIGTSSASNSPQGISLEPITLEPDPNNFGVNEDISVLDLDMLNSITSRFQEYDTSQMMAFDNNQSVLLDECAGMTFDEIYQELQQYIEESNIPVQNQEQETDGQYNKKTTIDVRPIPQSAAFCIDSEGNEVEFVADISWECQLPKLEISEEVKLYMKRFMDHDRGNVKFRKNLEGTRSLFEPLMYQIDESRCDHKISARCPYCPLDEKLLYCGNDSNYRKHMQHQHGVFNENDRAGVPYNLSYYDRIKKLRGKVSRARERYVNCGHCHGLIRVGKENAKNANHIYLNYFRHCAKEHFNTTDTSNNAGHVRRVPKQYVARHRPKYQSDLNI